MQLKREELNALIGLNVRKYRILQKMTIEDLAGKSGLSVHTVKQVERGQRGCTAWTLMNLASALNMSVEVLVAIKVSTINEIQVLLDSLGKH